MSCTRSPASSLYRKQPRRWKHFLLTFSYHDRLIGIVNIFSVPHSIDTKSDRPHTAPEWKSNTSKKMDSLEGWKLLRRLSQKSTGAHKRGSSHLESQMSVMLMIFNWILVYLGWWLWFHLFLHSWVSEFDCNELNCWSHKSLMITQSTIHNHCDWENTVKICSCKCKQQE